MKIIKFLKLYVIISVVFLFLQVFPYLFSIKWYTKLHQHMISPVFEWIDSLDSWILPMICSSIIVSCIVAFFIVIIIAIIQKFEKK